MLNSIFQFFMDENFCTKSVGKVGILEKETIIAFLSLKIQLLTFKMRKKRIPI